MSLDEVWNTADASDAIRREHDVLSESFKTAGYREGITAGKEQALQRGFDGAFSSIGVPIGRRLGTLRGVARALLYLLSSAPDNGPLSQVEGLYLRLTQLGLRDLAPPDSLAIEHAQEHASEAQAIRMQKDLSLNNVNTVDELELLRQQFLDILSRMQLSLEI